MGSRLRHPNLSNAKPCKVNRLMNRDRVSNSLARVSNQRGAVHVLRVACIGGVLVCRRLSNAQHIRPLLQSLGIVGVRKRGVSSSVPATRIISPA